MILHCITFSIFKYQTSSPWLNEFYSISSFIDNTVIQAKGILVSTLEGLVLQSEQYHPVAPTHLHNGLKCKRKNHYKGQATKYCPCSHLYYQVVSPLTLVHKEQGNKARVSGSQQDAHGFLVLTIQCNLIGGAEAYRRWNSIVWTIVTFKKKYLDCQVNC